MPHLNGLESHVHELCRMWNRVIRESQRDRADRNGYIGFLKYGLGV